MSPAPNQRLIKTTCWLHRACCASRRCPSRLRCPKTRFPNPETFPVICLGHLGQGLSPRTKTANLARSTSSRSFHCNCHCYHGRLNAWPSHLRKASCSSCEYALDWCVQHQKSSRGPPRTSSDTQSLLMPMAQLFRSYLNTSIGWHSPQPKQVLPFLACSGILCSGLHVELPDPTLGSVLGSTFCGASGLWSGFASFFLCLLKATSLPLCDRRPRRDRPVLVPQLASEHLSEGELNNSASEWALTRIEAAGGFVTGVRGDGAVALLQPGPDS